MLPLQDSSSLHQAPGVQPPPPHPSRPPAKDQALQTGEGHPPQLGLTFLSSRLFRSISAPPPLRDLDGQELGSLPAPSSSMPYRFQALGLARLGQELGPFFAQGAAPGPGELQELPPVPLGLAGARVPPPGRVEVLEGRPQATLHPILGLWAGDGSCSVKGF